MVYQVQRHGVWQSSFVARGEVGKKPAGAAPDFATDNARTDAVGWQVPALYIEDEWAGDPRTVMHKGKQYLFFTTGTSYQNDVRVLTRTPGGAWTDAGRLGPTSRPPVLVSHGEELWVFRGTGAHYLSGGSSLEVSVLDGSGKWSERKLGSTWSDGSTSTVTDIGTLVMPGIVSHGGQIHAVWSRGTSGLQYAVIADNRTGPVSKFPGDAQQPASRLSLVSYGGALHLVFAEGRILKHWIKEDGKDWVAAPDGPDTGTYQEGASSVVYDGKIHTFYNIFDEKQVKSEDVLDSILAKLGDGGESIDLGGDTPLELKGSAILAAGANERYALYSELSDSLARSRQEDSVADRQMLGSILAAKNPPATVGTPLNCIGYQVYDGVSWSGEVQTPLTATAPPTAIVIHDGAADTKGHIELVYTGVELWTPPPPPPPAPVGPEVTARKARRDGMVAKGYDGYSKLNHRLEASVHYNPDRDAYHVKATWALDAWALNWLGVAWRDTGGVSGKIKLVDANTGALVADHHFSVGIDGTTQVNATWEVRPGRYEFTICDARKGGGYWFPYSYDDPHRYSDVQTGWESVDVHVGK